MGQFALGIRSLLLKSIIFVILAALLAWTLGGRLWGPARTDFTGHAASWNGERWFWRLVIAGRGERDVRWNLMRQSPDGEVVVAVDGLAGEVAGPTVGNGDLFYASRGGASDDQWLLTRINPDRATESWLLPDRLAVEQQLERVRNGLPVQDAQTIASQRERVLDPKDDSTDER